MSKYKDYKDYIICPYCNYNYEDQSFDILNENNVGIDINEEFNIICDECGKTFTVQPFITYIINKL